jgi:hypothetical protein
MASLSEQKEMVEYFMDELGPTARLVYIGSVPSISLRPVGRVVLLTRECNRIHFRELSDVVGKMYPSFVFVQDDQHFYRPFNDLERRSLRHYLWTERVSMVRPTNAERHEIRRTGRVQYYDCKDPSLVVYEMEPVVSFYQVNGFLDRAESSTVFLPKSKRVVRGPLMMRDGLLVPKKSRII